MNITSQILFFLSISITQHIHIVMLWLAFIVKTMNKTSHVSEKTKEVLEAEVMWGITET